MFKAVVKSFIVGAALVALSTNVGAQAERPDTPDIIDSTFGDVQNTPDGDILLATFQMTASNTTAVAASSNFFYASDYIQRIQYPAGGVTEAATVAGFAFEPDRVKRGLDFTVVNQRDRAGVSIAAIRIITIGGVPTAVTFTGSNAPTAAPWIVPAGCATKGRANSFIDAAPQGFPYGAEDHYANGTAVVQCSNAGLSNTGMPSAGQDIMRSVFPASNDGTGFKAKAANLPNIP